MQPTAQYELTRVAELRQYLDLACSQESKDRDKAVIDESNQRQSQLQLAHKQHHLKSAGLDH